MNNGAQGQPAQGQPSGAQPQQNRQQITMYKPEQMRKLPDNFTQAEKEKWEVGLRSLYGQMEKNGPETQQHQDARRKLFEFSRTLTSKLQNFARQSQQAQQAQQGAAARPASQGQPQNQEGEPNGTSANTSQPARPTVPPKIFEHVQNFPYTIPPHMQAGTPEAQKWITEIKQRYLKGLVAMDTATQRIAAYDAMYNKRNEEGRPLNSEEEKEYREKKEAATKTHADAKQFVDNFRRSQQHARAAANPNQQGGNGNGSNTPVRVPVSTAQPPNPAIQNTQTVNAAIEAARNQQMGGGRPQIPQNGQGSQTAPSHQNAPAHQAGQVQSIKQEAGVSQMQGRPMQNNSPQAAVPHSAQPSVPQSAVSNPQVPRALTHPQALQTAARTYSNGQPTGTPNVMGHSHTHPSAPRETQNVITNKMPIPKHLHERATLTPQPVTMPQARPTLSGGPSNNGNGVLSQPVLQRAPGYNIDSEGDRVLNKKKLDELVRQVTGGGDGLGGGEALTPEVEEVSLILFQPSAHFLCFHCQKRTTSNHTSS